MRKIRSEYNVSFFSQLSTALQWNGGGKTFRGKGKLRLCFIGHSKVWISQLSSVGTEKSCANRIVYLRQRLLGGLLSKSTKITGLGRSSFQILVMNSSLLAWFYFSNHNFFYYKCLPLDDMSDICLASDCRVSDYSCLMLKAN